MRNNTNNSDQNTVIALSELQRLVYDFATTRDWLRFHNPKDVAAAIAIEAAELLECFLWRTDNNSRLENLDNAAVRAIVSELADVFIYALNLSNALQVNAAAIILEKLKENCLRFPPSDATE